VKTRIRIARTGQLDNMKDAVIPKSGRAVGRRGHDHIRRGKARSHTDCDFVTKKDANTAAGKIILKRRHSAIVLAIA